MAFTKAQLDAYIQGLYDDDGQLDAADNQLIINFILSNGNPELDPRDLIQIRRGDLLDMPNLAQGEMAVTLDTEELFVGGLNGNIKIISKKDIEKIVVLTSNPPSGLQPLNYDGTDETVKLQAIIDYVGSQNHTLKLEIDGDVTINSTVFIKNHNMDIKTVNSAEIIYTGIDYAIDVIPVSDVYPINCEIDLNVRLTNSNSKGIHHRFSHSTCKYVISMNTSGLTGNIGVDMLGDVNGTGPYYNMVDITIQGNSDTSQKGIDMTYDPSTPTRLPSANTIFIRRIGQVGIGATVMGNKNRFPNPTLEGVKTFCFDIGHPTTSIGCVDNTIIDPYIEGGSGVTVFNVKEFSSRATILYPYITSIVGGRNFVDNGQNTSIIYPSVAIEQPSKGFKLKQDTSGNIAEVRGSYPGWLLYDTVKSQSIKIRYAGQLSEGNNKLEISDEVGNNLIRCGTTEMSIFPSKLKLNNSSVAIHSGIGSPEGAISAAIGSIYLRSNGGAGTTFYVKESGTGATGWIAK